MSRSATQSALVRIRMTSTPSMYGAHDPRGGPERLDEGDEIVLDMSDPQQRAWAQAHREAFPSRGWFEVLEGEIPLEDTDEPEDSQQTEVAAVDPAIAELARGGGASLSKTIASLKDGLQETRKKHATTVGSLREKREELRKVEAAAELDGKDRSAIAKAEAKVSEAERDERSKRAAVDVQTERVNAELARLEPAFALADRREAAAAVDALRAAFETARRKQIVAFTEFLNVQIELADAHQQLDLAAQKSGQQAPTMILFGDGDMLVSWRDYVYDAGVDVGEDRGRWTAKVRDGR